jgi:hypothetical protein
MLLRKPEIPHLVKNAPHILWKQKIYHLVQKDPLRVPILGHMNPAQIFPPYFFKI